MLDGLSIILTVDCSSLCEHQIPLILCFGSLTATCGNSTQHRKHRYAEIRVLPESDIFFLIRLKGIPGTDVHQASPIDRLSDYSDLFLASLSTSFFDLLDHFVSVSLAYAFLKSLWSTFYKCLSFTKSETCDFTNSLDYWNLLCCIE